uniref:CHK kinase-like domain-containing protein n=1 Tax=Plectus sambesii TaxID=2011161 RepID=A0A914WZZ8_9BILA
MAPEVETHILSQNLTEKIENTFITGQYLLSVLQKALNTDCTVGKISSKVLGSDRGFLSVVIRVGLEWIENEKSDGLPRSVVLKVPSSTKLLEAEESQLSEDVKQNMFHYLLVMTHNAECSFYQLQPAPENVLRIPKLIAAKKYLSAEDSQAYIILEDLSETTVGRGPAEDLPISAVLQLADFLAELHAYSLTNTEWLLDCDMKFTFGKVLGGHDQINRDAVQKSLELLAEELPALKQYVGRLGQLYASLEDIDYIYTLYEDLEVPPVICMGDLWVNNILWKRDEHGKPTNDLAVVLDWQCAHPGIMTEDVCRLLVSSASSDTWRNHLEEILERYMTTLEKKLGAPAPFDLEKVMSAFRQSFKHCFLRIVAAYPLFIKMYATNDTAKKTILDRCQSIVEDAFAVFDGKDFGAYSK